MHELRAGTLLLCALLVSGCGDAPADRLAAAVDTVDGVARLSYPDGPARALPWSTDTVAVLGDALAGDTYQFDDVSPGGLATDPAGNLYVLDRQGGRVLEYGPTGEHRATFGRRGRGPGELEQPIALAVGPGDTVWVSDFSNSRITGYPAPGSAPRTLPFPENAGIPGQRIAALPDGFVTTFRPVFGLQGGGGGPARGSVADPTDAGMIPVLRVDRSLTPVDTLWQSREPPMDMVRLEVAGGVMVTMMSREFYPGLRWAPFPDGGVVIADSAAYVLHLVEPDGTVARTIARAPSPRATTEADREVARQRVREQTQGGGIRIGGGGMSDDARDEMLRQRLEKMTFADVIPRVVELSVDPAGRVWVGVSEETPDAVDRIDIYRRDGSLVGELRDFPWPDVFLAEDRIAALRRDELDVQQVVILDVKGQTGDRDG